ncbi:unnamed protein product [marine sediment metagenome]|uniref:Uncharacterized protein n=1 Tax=marine sediment metagenome TaxID=412755 RepID=X1C3V4_9ZZZZ
MTKEEKYEKALSEIREIADDDSDILLDHKRDMNIAWTQLDEIAEIAIKALE